MQMYDTKGKGPRAKFLRASGLGDDLIPVGDWNEQEYIRVAFDSHGNARFFGGEPNRPVLEVVPWPNDFDYQKWLLLTAEEREHA